MRGSGAAAVVAAWLGLACPALAHEFWIEPESFAPAPGDAIGLSLEVGEMLDGDPYPANPAGARRFTHTSGDVTSDVLAAPGTVPAGRVAPSPGLGVTVYESAGDILRYSAWQDFVDYLAYEGLGARAERHDALGFPRDGFTEVYFRAAKLLTQAGTAANPAGEEAPQGLPMELVAEANPYARGPGDALPVRLYWAGSPLPDHPVAVFWRDADGAARRELTTTGPDGRLELTLRPGMMLLNSVELRPAREETGFHWISVWASLAFAVR